MAGLMQRLTRLAQSPQGQQLVRRAQKAAADPENRRKVEELRKRLGKRR